MKPSAEQEIAGLMARAIGRLHGRPGSAGPGGADAVDRPGDGGDRVSAADRCGRRQEEQAQTREDQA